MKYVNLIHAQSLKMPRVFQAYYQAYIQVKLLQIVQK